MTMPRSQPSDGDTSVEPAGDGPVDETPDLNVHEVTSERTVLTEPDNTDGWIATDTTVTPSE
jgi:hypothetical protein